MNTDELPWYRQPMVWLVIAIPAATVPAGLATVAIAMHGADPVVADDYRADALGVNRDSARDLAATTGDVHATLIAADGTVTVTLRAASERAPQELMLHLSHATLASADRVVHIPRAGAESYRVAIAALPPGHWRAELAPDSGTWRLRGEFQAPLQELALDPRPGP